MPKTIFTTGRDSVITLVVLEVVVEGNCCVVPSFVSVGVSMVDSVGVSMVDSVGVSLVDCVGVSVVEMVVDSVWFMVKQFFG